MESDEALERPDVAEQTNPEAEDESIPKDAHIQMLDQIFSIARDSIKDMKQMLRLPLEKRDLTD